MRTRHCRASTMAFLVVALLAAVVPAAAGKSIGRPIRENSTGYSTGMVVSDDFAGGDTFEGRCSKPSQWVSTSSGSGVISHLGRVTWTSEHCFQLFSGTFGDAEVVITAANGDKLFGTYDGFMTGETTFAETMIITGGTGRFSEASGTIEETGWFDPDSGYMEITGVGSIEYDASDRVLGS